MLHSRHAERTRFDSPVGWPRAGTIVVLAPVGKGRLCRVGPAMYMYGVLAMVVVREAASQVLSPESRYQDANPVGLEDVEVDVQRAAIVRE